MPPKICKGQAKETGEKCKCWAVSGSDYCHSHGGRRKVSSDAIRFQYHDEGRTATEIAERTGLTEARIRQIVKKRPENAANA